MLMSGNDYKGSDHPFPKYVVVFRAKPALIVNDVHLWDTDKMTFQRLITAYT